MDGEDHDPLGACAPLCAGGEGAAVNKKEIASLHITISGLRDRVSTLTSARDENFENGKKWRALAEEREKILSTRDKQVADLKERLANSESENQRMRGYIQRVQEDDVVREELVVTGDPEGERRMVPKRRPTSFDPGTPYSDFNDRNRLPYMDETERRRNFKHWVTY